MKRLEWTDEVDIPVRSPVRLGQVERFLKAATLLGFEGRAVLTVEAGAMALEQEFPVREVGEL